jgi:hypothetical protein
MTEGNRKPVGFEQITDLDAAVALSVPARARVALFQAEDEGVRWRPDGTDPTDQVGHLLSAGEDLWYTSNLNLVRFIGIAAGAKLNVSFYA